MHNCLVLTLVNFLNQGNHKQVFICHINFNSCISFILSGSLNSIYAFLGHFESCGPYQLQVPLAYHVFVIQVQVSGRLVLTREDVILLLLHLLWFLL